MRYFLLLVFIAFLGSCSKKSDENQSKTELLTNKKWKLISFSGKLSDGTNVPDQYPSFPSYRKDDYWTFGTNFSFTYNEGPSKETNTDPDVIDFGTWKLTNNESFLELTSTMPQPPGYSTTYFPNEIISINSQQMKWETVDPSDGTIIYSTFISFE